MGEVLITGGMLSIEVATLTEAVGLSLVTMSVGSIAVLLLYVALKHADVEATVDLATLFGQVA
jgi:hypothetical protein